MLSYTHRRLKTTKCQHDVNKVHKSARCATLSVYLSCDRFVKASANIFIGVGNIINSSRFGARQILWKLVPRLHSQLDALAKYDNHSPNHWYQRCHQTLVLLHWHNNLIIRLRLASTGSSKYLSGPPGSFQVWYPRKHLSRKVIKLILNHSQRKIVSLVVMEFHSIQFLAAFMHIFVLISTFSSNFIACKIKIKLTTNSATLVSADLI